RLGQFDDALGCPLGGLGKGRNGGGVRRGHGAYFTVEPSIHEGCTAFAGSRKRRLERTGSIPSSSSLSPVHRGSTLHPDFRPFWESASSAGAGLTAAIAKALWWHVCNSNPQA